MKISIIKKCNIKVRNFILLALLFSLVQINAQSKADSLKQILATQLSIDEQINVEIQLAQIYLDNDSKKAKEYLDNLQIKLHKNSDAQFLIPYNISQSIYYRTEGLFNDAKKYAEQALVYANSHKDSLEFKAKIYNSLGAIADDESNIQVAIKFHLIALRYAEKYNDPTLLATILAGLGRAYLYLSEFDIAKEYLVRAIAIKEQSKQYDFYLAAYYTNLSNCYDAEGNYEESLYYLDKSIELNKSNNNLINLITAYNNKAYTLFLMKNLSEAETTVQLALFLSDSLNVEVEAMFPYSTYAEILFAQNRVEKASLMMEKSIELSKDYNDLYLAKYNLDLLYNINLKNGDYKQALEYFQQKSVVIDSIYNIKSRKEIEKLALEYETEKKNKEIELLNKENRINEIELKKSNQLQAAFLFATVLALLVLFLLWSRQKNKVKTDKLLKQAMEKDFEKKLAESEMQALRAQMNPHFLFNCLNSINSFIIKNKQEQASEYLAKFSKLIRCVLNNSKSSKVTLANELEALELYIEMEALRFSNKFEYKIKVDSEVEKDYIEIPPLIIQPYVENSIWHGLMHKKEGIGTLLIEIKKENDILVCTVEDNGIGREAALKLKSKSAVKRKSFGMNITEERLKYINHKYKAHTNIEVIDLKDTMQKGIGTRVVIKIEL